MTGTEDKTVLVWAADHDRVLPTHNVSTIAAHAYGRVMKGDAVPDIFEVSRRAVWVEDIILR